MLGTLLTVAIILVALVAVWLLPRRKRWNDDGGDDARRQAVQRDLPHRAPGPEAEEPDDEPAPRAVRR